MGHLRLFFSNTAPGPTQAARTQQCASEGADADADADENPLSALSVLYSDSDDSDDLD